MKIGHTLLPPLVAIAFFITLCCIPAVSAEQSGNGGSQKAAGDSGHQSPEGDKKDGDKNSDGTEKTENEKAVEKIASRLMTEGGQLTEEEKKQLAEMDGNELAKILQGQGFKDLFKNLDANTAKTLMGQLQRTLSGPNAVAQSTIQTALAANGANPAPAPPAQPVPAPGAVSGLNGSVVQTGTPGSVSGSVGVPTTPSTSDYGSGFGGAYVNTGSKVSPAPITPQVAPQTSTGTGNLQFNEGSTQVSNPQQTASAALTTATTAGQVTVSGATSNNVSPAPAISQVQALDPGYMDKIAPVQTQSAGLTTQTTDTKYGETGFVVRGISEPVVAAQTNSPAFFQPSATERISNRGIIASSTSDTPAVNRQRVQGEARPNESGPKFQFNERGAVQLASTPFEEELALPETEQPVRKRSTSRAVASETPRTVRVAAASTVTGRDSEGLNIQFSEEVPKTAQKTMEEARPAVQTTKPEAGYAAASLPIPFGGSPVSAQKGILPAAMKNPTLSLSLPQVSTTTVAAVVEETSSPLNKLIKGAQAAK